MKHLFKNELDFLPDNTDGIYVVGGTVRDLLIGRSPTDIDLVVRRDVDRIAGEIAEKCGGKVIPIGKNGFDVLRVASQNAIIDLTPLTHPCIEADLRDRDFTINAMAYDVDAKRLIDCTGGLTDLQQKTLRVITPSAFERDPARLVRAYRMAAMFHFSLSTDTRHAISRHAHRVKGVAGERIWAELYKIFSEADSASTIAAMVQSGLLTEIFPEMKAAIGCTQNRHHQFNVFDHCIQTYIHLESLLAEFGTRFPALVGVAQQTGFYDHFAMMKYSALLHDVGKPATRQVDVNGRIRFLGHAARSATIAAEVSRRLRLSRKQRDTADAIIRNHIRPLFLFLSSADASFPQRGMVRFFNRCGDLTLPIVIHTMADILAKKKVPEERDLSFIDFCGTLFEAYAEYKNRQRRIPPLVSGKDLISAFGLSPSPDFKVILKQVDERRLTGELTSRAQALKWVETHLKGSFTLNRESDSGG